MPQPYQARQSGPLRGDVRVPGDKSISHRALLFGALASGETLIHGLLRSADVLAGAVALEAMGVAISRSEDEDAPWRIRGRGTGGLVPPEGPLDLGNSGTAVRLLMGAIAGHDMTATLTGDASLSRRPMGRILAPLARMGLEVIGQEPEKARLPVTVRGSSDLVPISYELPVPSAQIKSAVLLAGLHAAGETTVIERTPSRDHSERMLAHFGAALEVSELAGAGGEGEGGRAITVCGHAELVGREVRVPGDPSSAAFPVAAALIVPGSEVVVRGVLANPTRFGFYETLLEMGADLKIESKRTIAGEPIADITARSGPLRGVRVPAERAPSMIDEYPILAVLAAFAEGETRMEGLAELRVKECDRLAVTAEGLNAAGVEAGSEGDTLIVRGRGPEQVPGGARIATELDHRIAMAFLTLGLASRAPIVVDDIGMIATSFPNFLELMGGLGAELTPLEGD